PKHAWRTITWREGTNDRLRSRFARVQVRTAPIRRAAERAEETLLIEWPESEAEPTKYWLSTLDKKISFRRLLVLLRHRARRGFCVKLGAQHGHRGRARAMATASLRWSVAIESGTCRWGRIGGAAGSVTNGKGRYFELPGGMRS